MKPLLGCLALLSFFLIPAHARLGETPDQIAKRFGITAPLTPVTDGPNKGMSTQDFKAKNFDIHILYSDVAMEETYRSSIGLSEAQIQAMLAAQSQGHIWRQTMQTPTGVRFWERDDGAAASLWPMVFTFKSKALCDKEEARRKAGLPDVNGI